MSDFDDLCEFLGIENDENTIDTIIEEVNSGVGEDYSREIEDNLWDSYEDLEDEE